MMTQDEMRAAFDAVRAVIDGEIKEQKQRDVALAAVYLLESVLLDLKRAADALEAVAHNTRPRAAGGGAA